MKAETNIEKFKRRSEQVLLLKRKIELELIEMKKKEEESKEKEVCYYLIRHFKLY